jgi:hypothetical protein
MEPNQITAQIVDAAYRVHTRPGLGWLESVYEVALNLELLRSGLAARRQVPIPIEYEGAKFDEGLSRNEAKERLSRAESQSAQTCLIAGREKPKMRFP